MICVIKGKPKNEILWKFARIALHLLVQTLRCHAIQTSEIGIENHALAAQDHDSGDHKIDGGIGACHNLIDMEVDKSFLVP